MPLEGAKRFFSNALGTMLALLEIEDFLTMQIVYLQRLDFHKIEFVR
jgi:hypothetical protein